MARVGEIVGAFGGAEGVEKLADGVLGRLHGAGRGGAEERLAPWQSPSRSCRNSR